MKSGRRVITVDLNPMSRTSGFATVTIIDNVVRVMPLLLERIAAYRAGPDAPRAALDRYDNARVLRSAEAAVRAGC